MTDSGAYRRIGTVLKPHGVRGAFFLFSETDFPEWLLARKRIFAELEGKLVPWTVTSARLQQDRIVFQVAEIDDRDKVEALRKVPLFVSEEEAREALADSEMFLNSDLIGLALFQGALALGEVVDVFEMPGQNLLEVRHPDGHTFHVPFAEQLIRSVDLEAGTMAVDLPEGLIDLNQNNAQKT